MRVFAFFLPQFHSIPENDEWWGEGFTEWINVKKAKPLFKSHNQPVSPLNDYYYNLLDKETVKWQTKLMDNYGIDGLIYYHYYFEGKLLLEKPAENLLANKEIKQHFFFCWANHSWKRSWEGKSTILVEQTYGREDAWEKHFQYLLPFFKDDRYEKKNNKPLFMVFLPYFEEKNEMFLFFDRRCKEEGFDGIAVIDSIQNVTNSNYEFYIHHPSTVTEYVFYREPGVGQSNYMKKHFLSCFFKKARVYMKSHFNIGRYVPTYSGDKIINELLKYKPIFPNALKGLFFEWDNTPRHGYRGYIIRPISKKIFKKFMKANGNQDYLFVNAWNEWCEGMILEPTKEKGYRYLEWIKEWKEQ